MKKNSPDSLICHLCSKKCSSIKHHLVTHIGTMPFHCKICSKGFISESHFEVHMKLHLNQSECQDPIIYLCNICDLVLPSCSALEEHYLDHLVEVGLECSSCNMFFSETIEYEIHQHLHTNDSSCMCGKMFSSRREMLQHVLTHCPEKHFSKFYDRVQFAHYLHNLAVEKERNNLASIKDSNKNTEQPKETINCRNSNYKANCLDNIFIADSSLTGDSILPNITEFSNDNYETDNNISLIKKCKRVCSKVVDLKNYNSPTSTSNQTKTKIRVLAKKKKKAVKMYTSKNKYQNHSTTTDNNITVPYNLALSRPNAETISSLNTSILHSEKPIKLFLGMKNINSESNHSQISIASNLNCQIKSATRSYTSKSVSFLDTLNNENVKKIHSLKKKIVSEEEKMNEGMKKFCIILHKLPSYVQDFQSFQKHQASLNFFSKEPYHTKKYEKYIMKLQLDFKDNDKAKCLLNSLIKLKNNYSTCSICDHKFNIILCQLSNLYYNSKQSLKRSTQKINDLEAGQFGKVSLLNDYNATDQQTILTSLLKKRIYRTKSTLENVKSFNVSKIKTFSILLVRLPEYISKNYEKGKPLMLPNLRPWILDVKSLNPIENVTVKKEI